MTDDLRCIRGCTRRGKHLPHCPARDDDLPADHDDHCSGCLPREPHTGLLCQRCYDRLTTMLADDTNPESIAAVCSWLADNLGQHVHSKTGGNLSRSANPGEGFVTVMTALSDLQLSWAELAAEFLDSRDMKPLADTHPAHTSDRLRPWASTLASWEPIADNLDHLTELRDAAHGACPWRGRHPDASSEAAAVLYLAPAEPAKAIAARFGVSESWVKVNRYRRRLDPADPEASRPEYRPWDAYRLLHPDAARRHEAAIVRMGEDVVVPTHVAG